MRLCYHTRSHDEQLGTRGPAQMGREVLDVPGPALEISYFRAPGGNWTPAIRRLAAENGMRPLGWSVDPEDWKRPGVEAIVARLEQQVHPGAVLLMHDGGGTRADTVKALDRFLSWAEGQSFSTAFP